MLLRIAARDLFTLDEKNPHQKVRKTLWQADLVAGIEYDDGNSDEG